jgi:hypothetical protein
MKKVDVESQLIEKKRQRDRSLPENKTFFQDL